jgi:type II secretory pathway pseudopilin PulG
MVGVAVTGRRGQDGFTYFTVVFLVAVLGLAASAAGTVWHTARQREKERELLAVGQEFRAAIARYLRATPSGRPQYPRNLDDLVQDGRVPGIARHLRRIYPDPVTGRPEWGLVKAPDGGIMGVHSLSPDRPRKRAGFPPSLARFEEAERYADWVFVHRERQTEGAPVPRPPR